MNQMASMQQNMNKMGMIIYQLTGKDVLGLTEGMGAPGPQVAMTPQASGKSMGSAATDAEKETMTAYGQRLAAHAKPDMESQQ